MKEQNIQILGFNAPIAEIWKFLFQFIAPTIPLMENVWNAAEFGMSKTMNCSECDGVMEPVRAQVRSRIGCPANCSGKIVEQIVAHKCSNCGFSFQNEWE